MSKKKDEKIKDEISLYLLSFFGGVWFLTKWCYYYCYDDGYDAVIWIVSWRLQNDKKKDGCLTCRAVCRGLLMAKQPAL